MSAVRHRFVTGALTAGNNPVVVQLVSGHKSGDMLKRYAHLTSGEAEKVRDTMDATQGEDS